ncbi:hypothetical protein [Pseudomonas sp. 22 E 5]|nr:hypothetical protein [Pseudomonas sp. 22 E 5]
MRHITVEVFDRSEGVRAVGTDGDRANARDDGGLTGGVSGAVDVESGDGQGIIDVDIVGQHIAGGNGIFQRTAGVGFQNAGIINCVDVHIQRAAGTGIGGVADLRHFTIEVFNRSKGVRAISPNGDGTHAGNNGGLASVECSATHAEGRYGQDVVDVAVVAQHVAGRNAIFGDGIGISLQNARIVHGNHGRGGRLRVDRQVLVIAAGGAGNGGADDQVFAIGQVRGRVDTDRTGGFAGFNGDGLVVGQLDNNVCLRRVGHGRGVDDLAAFIHRCGRGQRDGGGVDGVVDLGNGRRRVSGDDQVAAAGGAGDGGGDRRGIQVRRVIAGKRDVQYARGLAGRDDNRQAVRQGDGQVAGRRLGDEYGVNNNAACFGDGRRGGQSDGDVTRIDAVIVAGGLGCTYGVTGIQAGRRVTNGGVNHACGGFQHDKTVAAAGGAIGTSGGRAGSRGFKDLGRVGTGSDGLLEFGDGRCGLCGSGAEVGGRVRSAGAPLSVAAQVDDPAIRQLQRDSARCAGIDLLTRDQAVPFYEQAANPFRGNCEHLTDNAFDDRNAAHKRLSVYCRSGVSIKETGPLAAADSDSWSTQFV